MPVPPVFAKGRRLFPHEPPGGAPRRGLWPCRLFSLGKFRYKTRTVMCGFRETLLDGIPALACGARNSGPLQGALPLGSGAVPSFEL